MLAIISIMTQGQHQYFSKSYVPPPKQKENIASYFNVDNQDHFFTDLPASRSKKGSGSQMLLTALQWQEQKMIRLQQ